MDLTKAFQIGRYQAIPRRIWRHFYKVVMTLRQCSLSGGVRYQYTENKVDDFIGYAQQEAIANGKVNQQMQYRVGKRITTTYCLTQGCWLT